MKKAIVRPLCLLVMTAMVLTACGGETSGGADSSGGKDTATGAATTGAAVTSRSVDDREGPALKDLYADYFMMGAAINGSDKTTAAIRHEGMAAVLKKHGLLP